MCRLCLAIQPFIRTIGHRFFALLRKFDGPVFSSAKFALAGK